MELPLTLAIVALMACIGGLAWLFVRAEARSTAAHAEMMRVSKEYADAAIKLSADTARNGPKYADKMLETLSRTMQEVTRANSDAMTTMYAPMQRESAPMESDLGDLPTPWYAEEGAMDYSDPTDAYMVADPTEYPDAGGGLDGALVYGDDEEPFGVPGLKVTG